MASNGVFTRSDWEICFNQLEEFFCDVRVHIIMIFPFAVGSINIKPSTNTEIPTI
jgi:hypothetical protein